MPVTAGSACHVKHCAAAEVIELAAQRLTLKRRNDLSRVLVLTDWTESRCGHFATWWAQQLCKLIDKLSALKDDALVENLVDKWFILTLDMLENAGRYCGVADIRNNPALQGEHAPHCFKARTTQDAEWISNFKNGLTKHLQTRVRLVLHLTRNMRRLTNKIGVALECARAVGERALRDSAVRRSFLPLAEECAIRAPGESASLVRLVLDVTERDIAELVNLLAVFLVRVPREGSESILTGAHERICGWYARANKSDRALIRAAQETCVPHLLGYPQRPVHLQGAPDVLVRVGAHHGNAQVQLDGRLVDVAPGPDGACQGIQVQIPSWTYFRTQQEAGRTSLWGSDSAQHPIRVVDPNVEITWPGGRCACKATAVRGFTYKNEDPFAGSGIVLLLQVGQDSEWHRLTRSLLPTRYGPRQEEKPTATTP